MGGHAFTDMSLRALKPREKRYTVYEKDRRYEGFAVDVLPSGKLSFRYRYRLAGKRRWATIGSYPGMSLALARDVHREMVRDVHLGRVPTSPRKKASSSLATERQTTLEELANDWIESALRPANKNARQDITYLTRDVFPFLGAEPVSGIDRASLWNCIQRVRDRGHRQAARRVQSVLKRLFGYAKTKGLIIVSPVEGIDPRHIAKPGVRERVLSPEEIPAWLHAVETSSLSKPLKLALRILFLIPVRKGELLSAKWTDIDLVAGTWDIPRENSKTGAPLRHRLSGQVLRIFQELKSFSAGSVWVLPSNRGNGKNHLASSTLNTALRGINGLPVGVVIHDLRRTVRTYLSELGVSEQVAELCLNHRKSGVAGIYDKSELIAQRAEALSKWESYVAGLLAPEVRPVESDKLSAINKLLDDVRDSESLRRYVLDQILSWSQSAT